MTGKKIVVALALLLSATSATLANGYRHHRAFYDYAPGYGYSSGGVGGAVGGGESGDMGIGSQR
jgi:hypothetical protein